MTEPGREGQSGRQIWADVWEKRASYSSAGYPYEFPHVNLLCIQFSAIRAILPVP